MPGKDCIPKFYWQIWCTGAESFWPALFLYVTVQLNWENTVSTHLHNLEINWHFLYKVVSNITFVSEGTKTDWSSAISLSPSLSSVDADMILNVVIPPKWSWHEPYNQNMFLFSKDIFHNPHHKCEKNDSIVLFQIYKLQAKNCQSQNISSTVWEKQKSFSDTATLLSGVVHILFC